MKLKFKLSSIFGIAVVALSISVSAHAQGTRPPAPDSLPRDPGHYRILDDANKDLRFQESGLTQTDIAPASAGPDLFGYMLDDSISYSWVDARSGGTVVSFSNSYSFSGVVELPFQFNFYENAYTRIYINPNGHLSFQNGSSNSQGSLIIPYGPNNIIAPWWTPLSLATSGTTNRVYYKFFGTAPNRYVVVEWYQVKGAGDSNLTFTFEVILYENGNIRFQYHTISGTYMLYCATAGIEDSSGYDGLVFYDFCGWTPSLKNAVQFVRPVPSAHLNAYPRTFGGTLNTNGRFEQQFNLKNTGELGADTYEITVAPNPSWEVTLYNQDSYLLGDTNGNGAIDTGSLIPGQTVTIKMVAQRGAPIVNIGDVGLATVTLASALNPSKTANIQLQLSVPPAFGQIYNDYYIDDATSLDLVGSAGTRTLKTSPNQWSTNEHATATAPNGNLLTAWTTQRCIGSICDFVVGDVEYAINGPSGNSLRGVTQLTDSSAAVNYIFNYDLSAAAAPDGRIGIAWYQMKYDSQYKHQCNVFSAILDSNGDQVSGPTNLTNQTAWVSWEDDNAPCYSNVRLAATSDNRFITTYQSEYTISSEPVDDIFISVQSTSGTLLQGAIKLTADTPGWDKEYSGPNLIPLSNNQALLTFQAVPEYDLMGIVLDSSGGVVKSIFNITNNGNSDYEWMADGILLPNGKILIAWWSSGVTYALLDPGPTFNIISGPIHLASPYAVRYSANVSVTADAASHAIISWAKSNSGFSPNLYYAVVNGDGSLLLNTTILRSAGFNGNQYINTSWAGSGNTRLLTPPAPDGVDLFVNTPALIAGVPGGPATVQINLGNLGLTAATSTLTADLGTDLGFVSASPAPTSSSSGNISWDLSRMDYLGAGSITLTVSIPGGAANGVLFPLEFSIQPTAGSEVNPPNNIQTMNIMAVVHRINLSAISR